MCCADRGLAITTAEAEEEAWRDAPTFPSGLEVGALSCQLDVGRVGAQRSGGMWRLRSGDLTRLLSNPKDRRGP